jgi:ketosteroid isomerase-like protein
MSMKHLSVTGAPMRARLLAPLSRRLALAFGCLAPLAACATTGAEAAASEGSDEAAQRLIQRVGEANAAFMRGDMTAWYERARPIAGDFTLMQPFGGPPSRGFDGSQAHLEQLARYFQKGVTAQEIVETYATADMVVLVLIERQHGEVGGLRDQEWSLRVTQVFRRRGDVWEYVHRHADPLVRNIGLEAAAALARG